MRFGDKASASIRYIAERPTSAERQDLTDWLNQKACDGWVLLAVDDGVYIFGKQESTLYELDATRKLRQIPFGPYS